jgi:FkbM family methyltransferase
MQPRDLVKKIVISAEVRCHILGSLKWRAYRLIRGLLRMPHRSDFEAISCFAPSPLSLFLDIGANVGQSIDSIRLYAPESPIISFEPNPFLAAMLRSLFENDRHVTIEECGLGSATGRIVFFIPCYNGYVWNDLASLKEEDAVDWWLKKYIWNYQSTKFSMIKQSWTIHRLDEFNLEPFFIKVDAQGKEIEVVRGGLATIAKCKPIMMLRGVSYEGELREMLYPLGYRMYSYRKGHFVLENGLLWHAFFITDERLPRARIQGSTSRT